MKQEHRRSGLARIRAAAWPGIVVTLTLVGLLAAFHQVVRGAVRQGETSRHANALHADAVWRCKALRTPRVRFDCLVRLDAPPGGDSPLPVEHMALIAGPT